MRRNKNALPPLVVRLDARLAAILGTAAWITGNLLVEHTGHPLSPNLL